MPTKVLRGSDDFARSNRGLDDDLADDGTTTWKHGAGDGCSISSEKAIGDSDDASQYENASHGNIADSYCEIVTVLSGRPGVVARHAAAIFTDTSYAGEVNDPSNGAVQLRRNLAGVPLVLGSAGAGSYTAGARLGVWCEGTTIKLQVDDVDRISASNSDIATGRGGIKKRTGTSSATMDTWRYYELVSTPPPAPAGADEYLPLARIVRGGFALAGLLAAALFA